MSEFKHVLNFASEIVLDAMLERKESNGTFNYIKARRMRKATFIAKLSAKFKHPKRKVPKVLNYVKVIKSLDGDIFYSHFRMGSNTFKKLVEIVRPMWKEQGMGRPGVTVESALYLTIWYLANRNTFREISDRFGVSKGTAYYTTLKMCKILTALSKDYIRWPSNNEHEDIIQGFSNLRTSTFPNVAGCVDGTHIPIAAPMIDASSYFNRKGFHSILMQGICDHNLIFIDIFFGWPGRAHDANVWDNSPIGKALATNEKNLPNNSHLLGDSAYALQTYLMVPYKNFGNLSSTKKKYNTVLSSTRVCIEQAFGCLKSKFRCLNFLNVRNLNHLKFFVMDCVVLHNFIIINEKTNIGDVQITEPTNDCLDTNIPSPTEAAENKRTEICQLISGM